MNDQMRNDRIARELERLPAILDSLPPATYVYRDPDVVYCFAGSMLTHGFVISAEGAAAAVMGELERGESGDLPSQDPNPDGPARYRGRHRRLEGF